MRSHNPKEPIELLLFEPFYCSQLQQPNFHLGDREFGSVDLAQWLKTQAHTYFCLRLKRNEYIEFAPDIWVKLQELGVTPGISIYLEGVKVTKSKGFKQANIAAKWKGRYRGCGAE